MGKRDFDVEDVREVMSGLVPDPLRDAYLALLRTDDHPDDDAGAIVNDERAEELVAEGLACRQDHADGHPRLVPVPLELAMQAYLARQSQRALAAQQQLLTGQRRLADLQRAHHTGEDPHELIEIVTEAARIRQLSITLVNAARHEFLSLDNTAVETMEGVANVPPPFSDDVRCRAIYDRQCLDTRIGAALIHAAVESGAEEARIAASVPMKMKLADEAIALVPLYPSGMAGALLVQAPTICAALRQYFELLWRSATPLNASEPIEELSAAQARVLRLLAQGLDDQAIACRLGISPQTVRRHVTAIRETVGVKSRFALGATAHRRGWIP